MNDKKKILKNLCTCFSKWKGIVISDDFYANHISLVFLSLGFLKYHFKK